MTATNPRKLRGPWTSGYALDVHSTGSEFLGYYEYGHEQYETHRTDLGELLYRVKYKGDDAALERLVSAIAAFVESLAVTPDVIVPVPPTRLRRVQPLFRICDGVGAALRIPVARTAVKKAAGPELKDLRTFEDRTNALENAITVDAKKVTGKTVLLIDDLIRSGATIAAVTTQIKRSGARAVHALAVTATRRK